MYKWKMLYTFAYVWFHKFFFNTDDKNCLLIFCIDEKKTHYMNINI